MTPETVKRSSASTTQVREALYNQRSLVYSSFVLRSSEPQIPILTWALSAGVPWTQHQIHEAVVFCFQEFRGSAFYYIFELSRILLHIVQLHKRLQSEKKNGHKTRNFCIRNAHGVAQGKKQHHQHSNIYSAKTWLKFFFVNLVAWGQLQPNHPGIRLRAKYEWHFRLRNSIKVFTWRHGSHVDIPKKWNGGQVGLPVGG